jgi:hypothetical protein
VHKVVIESFGTLKGKTIEGIALTPAVSLNHNIYSAEAIDNAKNLGVTLPANWEHTEEMIGDVVYSLGPNHSILYKAEIKTERANELKEGVHKVSIEANIDEVVESCNRKGCYNLVDGITFEGIGITTNPGVQTTTLNIIESSQDWPVIKDKTCEKCTLKINEESNDEIKLKIEQLEQQVKDLSRPKCTACGKPKKI